ncbi:MAG: hypothetical protein R3Y58_01180 [Eubacteriales bacterium]
MRFYEKLLLSDAIKESKETVIEKIETGKLLFHTYIIAVPIGCTDSQLEIFHVEFNNQLIFKNQDYLIVGISVGYQEAIDMVVEITHHIYKETSDAQIKKYYISKL